MAAHKNILLHQAQYTCLKIVFVTLKLFYNSTLYNQKTNQSVCFELDLSVQTKGGIPQTVSFDGECLEVLWEYGVPGTLTRAVRFL